MRESRRFETMYILQGKTQPTRHVRFSCQFTYARCTLLVDGLRTWQPFIHSSTDLNRSTAPEKKGSWHNPQHTGRPIRGSVPSFSLTIANGAVGKSQASVDNRLLGLPGPYHWHVIGTFNTCSRVPTHRSLTDTGGGYHIETLRIATALPRPSLSRVSLIPLNCFMSNMVDRHTQDSLAGHSNIGEVNEISLIKSSLIIHYKLSAILT
jgi:hypothetical protein